LATSGDIVPRLAGASSVERSKVLTGTRSFVAEATCFERKEADGFGR